jgi:hypothetical protein
MTTKYYRKSRRLINEGRLIREVHRPPKTALFPDNSTLGDAIHKATRQRRREVGRGARTVKRLSQRTNNHAHGRTPIRISLDYGSIVVLVCDSAPEPWARIRGLGLHPIALSFVGAGLATYVDIAGWIEKVVPVKAHRREMVTPTSFLSRL